MPDTSTWPAVEQAVRAICTGRGNINTLSDLIRGLAGVGLGSLVEPILSSINLPVQDWDEQRKTIISQAAKLGSGVAWGDYSGIFRGNLEALAGENPSLNGLPELTPRYGLYRAGDGNFQILDRQAPNVFAGMVGGLTDHKAVANQWTYRCPGYQAIRPVAFDGAGYGWMLRRVLETTEKTFVNYSCAVYILESDPAAIAMLLHLNDLRPWAKRLRFFVGGDAIGQFERALRERPHWLAPGAVICDRLSARTPLDIQPTLKVIEAERHERDKLVKERVRQHYENLTPEYWAARYEEALAGGKPLKVLGITSRYTTVLQYSMDELGAAVRAGGHEFILAKEVDDQSLTQPEQELIAEHKPDLLVLISRMRYENPHLPKNVPFLCWDQDNLPCMRTPEAGKSLDAFTYVAGTGAMIGYQTLNWPRRNCIITFLAASTHRYGNGPVEKSLFEKHRCTFSYTSNCAGTPLALAEEIALGLKGNPAVQQVFLLAAKEIIARASEGFVWDALPMAELLDGVASRMGTVLDATMRRDVLAIMRRVSDRAFRHVALGWVADYCRRTGKTLRLYGSGWEANPRFAEFAAGFLAPGEEMRAVYQASDINLQIIETGFQHSRSLDGLAAGGFFLNRAGAEMREFDKVAAAICFMTKRAQETGCVTFGQLEGSDDPVIREGWAIARQRIRIGAAHEVCDMLDRWEPAGIEEQSIPDLDEITFASQDEFAAMADRYLGNEELRRGVADKFRKVVVDKFSYDARWRQFLTSIAAGLKSAAAEGNADALRQAA